MMEIYWIYTLGCSAARLRSKDFCLPLCVLSIENINQTCKGWLARSLVGFLLGFGPSSCSDLFYLLDSRRAPSLFRWDLSVVWMFYEAAAGSVIITKGLAYKYKCWYFCFIFNLDARGDTLNQIKRARERSWSVSTLNRIARHGAFQRGFITAVVIVREIADDDEDGPLIKKRRGVCVIRRFSKRCALSRYRLADVCLRAAYCTTEIIEFTQLWGWSFHYIAPSVVHHEAIHHLAREADALLKSDEVVHTLTHTSM